MLPPPRGGVLPAGCQPSAAVLGSPHSLCLRPSLLLPNRLAMMETLEDAPDPFFGMMSVAPTLPSPFSIPQVGLVPHRGLRLLS